MPRPLQVFLCHASQDKPDVLKLHRNLKRRNVKPWLDQLDLLPGENWEIEIPNALASSDVILVCLSKNSVDKEGYVQKEITFALDKALEKPDGTIFIIPVKLEECDLPKKLARFQAVELFRRDGFNRLLLGLNKRVRELGDEISPIILEETRQRTPRPIKSEIQMQPQEKSAEIPKPEIPLENKQEKEVFARLPKKIEEDKPKFIPEKESIKPISAPFNIRPFGIGGIILIGILGILFAGNYFINNLPANETPEITSTEEITNTSTVEPTITATKSLAISTTTRLDIGSTTLGNDGMVLMYVPAGEFTMGSNNSNQTNERPEHQVYLNAFWIDQKEVTYERYLICLDAGRCNPPSQTVDFTNDSYLNHPVVYISWEDAKTYCEWTGRRLPTEAEWEKAARGTESYIYPWGNDSHINDLSNYVNVNLIGTTEVGSYPNGKGIYGAFDMAGNVWEWVNDWYDAEYYEISPSSNPTGPQFSTTKVLRGGSWANGINDIRSAYRLNYPSTFSDSNIGFRCAMDAD